MSFYTDIESTYYFVQGPSIVAFPASRIASPYWEINRMFFQNISWEGFATILENGTVALPGDLFRSYADVALVYGKIAKRHFMVALRMFKRVPARNKLISTGSKMYMLPA